MDLEKALDDVQQEMATLERSSKENLKVRAFIHVFLCVSVMLGQIATTGPVNVFVNAVACAIFFAQSFSQSSVHSSVVSCPCNR